MCSTRNRHFIFPVQGLPDFWTAEHECCNRPGCSTLWRYKQNRVQHRGLRVSLGQRAAQAQLSPHTGTPAASWETPLGHHPSRPGSNFLTHRTLALTPAPLWFMSGSCCKASRAPLPARRHQSQAQHPQPRSHSTNRKPQGRRKYRTDASTAVPDKGNTEINKVLIYCGKKKAGSGEWVGEGEKQKLYLEKKENLKWGMHS